MPVRPDFGPRAGLADKGIVGRHAAVDLQPHHLALQLVQVLRGRALVVLAQRDEQIPLAVKHQARPEVQAGRQLGRLAKQHLEILQARRVVRQASPADSRAALVPIGFRIRQIQIGRAHV
ncbi:hypothetical protein G6F65_020608 [Rhizopus arrhizus]|nr:hypothetical protein G6F65_020608 [Rhizopus arrhizus]